MISTPPTLVKFFDAMDILIRLNEDSRQEFAEQQPGYISKIKWMVEFGTLNINVARRTGKTSYIQKRAACADLVITRNEWLKKEYYRGTCATVLTVDQIRRNVNWGFKGSTWAFNRVWFDDSWSAFSDEEQMHIYQCFTGETGVRACANVFIMMGTGV